MCTINLGWCILKLTWVYGTYFEILKHVFPVVQKHLNLRYSCVSVKTGDESLFFIPLS